jgi:hypothetical protein
VGGDLGFWFQDLHTVQRGLRFGQATRSVPFGADGAFAISEADAFFGPLMKFRPCRLLGALLLYARSS